MGVGKDLKRQLKEFTRFTSEKDLHGRISEVIERVNLLSGRMGEVMEKVTMMGGFLDDLMEMKKKAGEEKKRGKEKGAHEKGPGT